MVSIKGQQNNCEDAERRIKVLTDLSTKKKHHDHSEVCVHEVYLFLLFSNDAHVSVCTVVYHALLLVSLLSIRERADLEQICSRVNVSMTNGLTGRFGLVGLC